MASLGKKPKAKKSKARKPRAPRRHKRISKHLNSSSIMTRFNKYDPFPPKFFTNLVYQGSYNIASNTLQYTWGNQSTNFTWNLNSPWDPFVPTTPTTLNTTALGVYELTPIYRRMKVFGVKVTVEFRCPNSSGGGFPSVEGIMAGVLIRNPSVTQSTFTLNSSDVGETEKQPYVWTKYIPSTGGQKCRYSQYFPMYQLFELTKRQYNDDIASTTTSMAASPASLVQMDINVANMIDTVAINVNFDVKIEFYTMLYQRNALLDDG